MRPFLLLFLLLPGCAFIAAFSPNGDPDAECQPGMIGFLRCSYSNGPVVLGDEVTVPNPEGRRFFLTRNELGFVDAFGSRWTAPVGTATDGASIPGPFEVVVGDADSPEFREATAIHDAYCGRGNEKLLVYQSRPWRQVHRAFYDALIVNGVGQFRAKVMFVAVYLGGPRWDDPKGPQFTAPAAPQEQELRVYSDWIQSDEPGAAVLEYVMDEREEDLRQMDEGKSTGIAALRVARPLTVQDLRDIAATR